ncbi:hypothetical protein [Gracilibacillus sp. JCM 18860]|uniref:hypothetical protein n=1 Tax=Gracilibacillus sp. JCM 18860 TaxID=1306159 RepID=UPI000AB5F4AC
MTKKLNSLGKDGWELTGGVEQFFILKESTGKEINCLITLHPILTAYKIRIY